MPEPRPEFAPEFADVAIAIACYNQSRFLADAIRSALEQSVPPREIIVVDDGSSDDTRAVARGFPHVRYIFQENAGLSAARNTGLAHATASHILFLDADDWLSTDAVRFAIAAIHASPKPLAFVHGGYLEVAEDGSSLSTHLAQPSADAFRSLLRGNYIAMHGTVLYDTAILRTAGGFDTTLGSCEDYDVYLRLARDHAISSYPGIAARYRRHSASLSRDRLVMIETALRVIDRHLHRSDRTRLDTVAARVGRRAMIDYYAHQIAIDFRHGASRTRVAAHILSGLVKRPRLAAQLAAWAIGRWTRAVTTTG